MRNTQWLSTLTNVVLVGCALVVTGVLVRREFFGADAASPEAGGQMRRVPDWARYAAEGHRAGPAATPVNVVVFSDYQCPACRKLAEDLKDVREEFGDQVAVVNRHFPLASHPAAIPAARASECAARQGAFEAMHGALVAGQSRIGDAPWGRFAQEAGVRDLPAFDACMAETGPIAAVGRDTVGILVTPIFQCR